MNKQKDVVRFILLLLKCYIIIIVLGFIVPKVLEFILEMFINGFNKYNNSTFVFDILSRHEAILYRYMYIINLFFHL